MAALKLSKQLILSNIIDFTQLSADHSIVEIEAPESWVGSSVIKLNLRSQYGINIIAIKYDGHFHTDFDPAYILREGGQARHYRKKR